MSTDAINSITDIQELVLAGETNWKQYGEVNAVYNGDLVLFNYTQMAQFAGRWNWFERNSRGLILNAHTGEVAARPFPKFFNYGERVPAESAQIVSITEKMDGSLGILYRTADGYRIATRGSFTSDQAIWAMEWLKKHPPVGLSENLTLLFEIIFPQNRIVVDYGTRAELVLLAAINRFTGEELSWHTVEYLAGESQYATPRTYTFESLSDMLEAAKALTANQEGWVVHYDDGSRFKLKGDAYRIAHKIMTGATFKRVLEAVESGQFDAMIEGVPDEFLAQVRLWKAEIETEVAHIRKRVAVALAVAPQGTQKEFALWVQERFDKEFQAYLFAAKSGKPLLPIIYKRAFENRKGADMPVVQDIDA